MTNQDLKVVLIERVLPHYRVRFYDDCRSNLERQGIAFSLVYGQPDSQESKKKDTADLTWAHRIRNVYAAQMVYQPCWRAIRDCDLVIVEQANKLLLNYLLFALRPFNDYKIAFIGHGHCHQQHPGSLPNRFKRLYTNRADWWFPYTDPIAEFLHRSGFPADRITVLDNAIDTREMAQISRDIPAAEVAELRRAMGLEGAPVGVFCGGMYAEKELSFLLAACARIREKVPGFQMIFIGAGRDAHLVERAGREADWIHFVGPRFGREKVRLLMAADVFLMPGLVGLAILDCFAVGLPLLTTRYEFHSPEIAYIRDNENGMVSDFDPESYARMVVRVLDDRPLLTRLKEGSARSRDRYSMENMVEKFCAGVKRCLEFT